MKKVILILFLILNSLTLHAEAMPEHLLKSAFLYNFALLIDWPDTLPPNQFRICFYQKTLVNASEALNNKTVHERNISILTVSTPQEALTCQMLFIRENEKGNDKALLKALDKKSILVVTEYPDTSDSHIAILRNGTKLIFDINLANLKTSHLLPSSHLLKLAHQVTQ